MKAQILVIDNSKAIQFLLHTVLGGGYEVVTASDGCAAMHWLRKKDIPGLIIADPQLPDMKDWELIEHLVSSGLYGSIPLLVLSAFDIKETELRCNEIDINYFFVKPFNPVDLVKTVDQIIASGNLRQYPSKVVQP